MSNFTKQVRSVECYCRDKEREWRDSFEKFLEDMGERPSDKYTIERLDNDKWYCKENCCWLLKELQRGNQRKERRPAGTSPNYEIKRQAYLRRKERGASL